MNGSFGWPVHPQAGRPYILVQDQKTQNTDGGTFTTGSDQTRVLNTIVVDSHGLVSLANNQVTLPPGTYQYFGSAPAYLVARNQTLLYNVTDAVTVHRGTVELAGIVSAGTSSSSVRSFVWGYMVLQSTKSFELRHRCQITVATLGLGVAGNFGVEVYASVEFWKLA